MSDVTEKMFEEKTANREELTAVELTEKELEAVSGAFFNNSTAFAVTTIAFTQNNNCVW
jgi:hypothetical protein